MEDNRYLTGYREEYCLDEAEGYLDKMSLSVLLWKDVEEVEEPPGQASSH